MTITHRMSGTPTYKSWRKMKERCNDPNATQWKWYGGRGVRVCARWNDSFQAFFDDMGERPAGMTLDRIDSNGHYEPGNCRWATHRQQVLGQRKTIRTPDGKTLREACEKGGVSFGAVYQRHRRGITGPKLLQRGILRQKKSPEALRQYARMRLDGLKNREVAERLGMSESGIEKWAKAARKEGLL